MVGDTRYDIEAARRAGVGLIAVQCGGSTLAELTDAIAIYRDPAHLLDELGDAPI